MFSATLNGSVYAGSFLTGIISSLTVLNPIVDSASKKVFDAVDPENKIDVKIKTQTSATAQRLTGIGTAYGLFVISEYLMQTSESNATPHALFSLAGLALASNTMVPAACYLTARTFQALGASSDLNHDFTTLTGSLSALEKQGRLSRETGLVEVQGFIDKHGLNAYRAMYTATLGGVAIGVLGANVLGGYMMATHPDFKRIMNF